MRKRGSSLRDAALVLGLLALSFSAALLTPAAKAVSLRLSVS